MSAIQTGMFSERSDVYSYAMTLYEIISDGQDLYPNMGTQDAAIAVTQRDERPLTTDAMKKDARLYDLMRSESI